MRESRIYTTKEIAAHLRVSPAHILREVAAGRLRPLRLGKKTFRYTEAEVDRYTSREAGYGIA